MSDPLRVLEGAHTMSILLFVYENPGCLKTDIYKGVTRNQSLPKRLEELETAGLLVLEEGRSSTRIRLTEKGKRVAECISAMHNVMTGCCDSGTHPETRFREESNRVDDVLRIIIGGH